MRFSTPLATVRVALLRSSWCSCFMRAALFIMRATNSSLVFTFLFVDFAFRLSSIPTDENRICTRQLQQLYLHTHWKLDTCLFIWTYLLGIVHTTTSENIYYSSWNTLYIYIFVWCCVPGFHIVKFSDIPYLWQHGVCIYVCVGCVCVCVRACACTDLGGHAFWGGGLPLLVFWNSRFESHRRHGCLLWMLCVVK